MKAIYFGIASAIFFIISIIFVTLAIINHPDIGMGFRGVFCLCLGWIFLHTFKNRNKNNVKRARSNKEK